jgi:muramoyltetrapeptide carboxypeptidase LdcA involved in peptidoglycan recycling
MRYPAPLQPGDLIGVTAPSSGVRDDLRPRLDFCVADLRERGFEVRVGDCMGGDGILSAPVRDRAAELTAMLLGPTVRAVVPPWGGELAMDLLPFLDFAALAGADPTWLVGYSDISTVLAPLTMLTGTATLHSPNLMDTPYRVPEPLVHWLDTAATPAGGTVRQGSATHRQEQWADIRTDPAVREMALTVPTRWQSLDGSSAVRMAGRLIGGCLETVAMLPGTPYGDVAAFAERDAPEGLVIYLEAAESDAAWTARLLLHLRYAGWFDRANGILVGRTPGGETDGFTQVDALHHALDGLDVPVLYDVDTGHVPPQLALVNGASAVVELHADGRGTLVQTLD